MSQRALCTASACLVLWLAGCATRTDGPSHPGPVGLANPASTFCIEQGGRVDMVRDAGGGEMGMCHLPDGRIVEEWALFRNETSPSR